MSRNFYIFEQHTFCSYCIKTISSGALEMTGIQMADIKFGRLTHPDLKDLEHAVVPYTVIGKGANAVLVPVKSVHPGEQSPSQLGKRYECALSFLEYDGRFEPVVGVRYEKNGSGVDVLVETILHYEGGRGVETDVPFVASKPPEHKYLFGTGYIHGKPIDLGCGTQILCTKAGGNTAWCDGQRMALQIPRPLPSSD